MVRRFGCPPVVQLAPCRYFLRAPCQEGETAMFRLVLSLGVVPAAFVAVAVAQAPSFERVATETVVVAKIGDYKQGTITVSADGARLSVLAFAPSARDCRYRAVSGHTAHSVVALIGEVDISLSIHAHIARIAQACRRGWSAIPCEPRLSTSRDNRNSAFR